MLVIDLILLVFALIVLYATIKKKNTKIPLIILAICLTINTIYSIVCWC